MHLGHGKVILICSNKFQTDDTTFNKIRRRLLKLDINIALLETKNHKSTVDIYSSYLIYSFLLFEAPLVKFLHLPHKNTQKLKNNNVLLFLYGLRSIVVRPFRTTNTLSLTTALSIRIRITLIFFWWMNKTLVCLKLEERIYTELYELYIFFQFSGYMGVQNTYFTYCLYNS